MAITNERLGEWGYGGFAMRFYTRINRLCYLICILSIAVAAATAFVGIWSRMDDGLMWRGLLSSFVSFSACALTIGVNNVIGRRIVLDTAPQACDRDHLQAL